MGSPGKRCGGKIHQRHTFEAVRRCQQCMADYSRFGPCPSIPISQSPRAHPFERFWRTLSTCSRHYKVLLKGSGDIMRLSVFTVYERATHPPLISTFYLHLICARVLHHCFFSPAATSPEEHNWVGEASQSLQIQAAMVHGEVRKKFGKGGNAFSKVVNLNDV